MTLSKPWNYGGSRFEVASLGCHRSLGKRGHNKQQSRGLPSHSRASRLVEHGDEPRAVQQNTLVEIEERREQ